MHAIAPNRLLARLESWRHNRRVRRLFVVAMIGTGIALATLTVAALSGMEQLSSRGQLRAVLMADFVYALVVAALVARKVVAILAARRGQAAGSRLHLRLTRVFTTIALIPTILVAVFATISLNFGLEGWFSDRVRNVVGSSLAAAQAYEEEHKSALQADALLLAGFLNDQKERFPLLSGGQLRELLTSGQLQMQRTLPKAFVIDGDARIRARGDRSYLFDYAPPSPEEIDRARAGEVVVIQDWAHNEFRALVHLPAFLDQFLYVSREVDGEILSLLDETRETVRLYQQLEADRGRLIFEFALIYLGVALVVILAAIWMALWFAERLARPVGRLAGAAQRVGAGDMDVKVPEEEGNDEIAVLGRVFNDMTRQVKAQRDALIAANAETERRRRLFDSVLSGVTAGVIGLDNEGRIEVLNAAAAELTRIDRTSAPGRPLAEAVPDFADLFRRLEARPGSTVQGEVSLDRAGADAHLLVRMAARQNSDGELEGYVISFDDVTDLVVAQRLAAWGDVARRIAHEVKNPLTPIQLSAERMRRKFGPLLGDQREALEQYASVIIRQTNDLRRIVDEFSKFARMPAPDRRPVDLGRLAADAVLLQENARPEIHFALTRPAAPLIARVDETMLHQALTNLMKNAAEAIDARQAAGAAFLPRITVTLGQADGRITLDVQDNGIGLPDQPQRLFEPYVTHRPNGTGLGLSIVKKIIEEHGGSLDLRPAPAFEADGHRGAWAAIVLPQDARGHGQGDDTRGPGAGTDAEGPEMRESTG